MTKFVCGPYRLMQDSDKQKIFAENTYLGTIENNGLDVDTIRACAQLFVAAPLMYDLAKFVTTHYINNETYTELFNRANEIISIVDKEL